MQRKKLVKGDLYEVVTREDHWHKRRIMRLEDLDSQDLGHWDRDEARKAKRRVRMITVEGCSYYNGIYAAPALDAGPAGGSWVEEINIADIKKPYNAAMRDELVAKFAAEEVYRAAALAEQASEKLRQELMLVLFDQLGFTELRVFGSGEIRMPNSANNAKKLQELRNQVITKMDDLTISDF
jgi:hypothetical protein